MSLYIQCILKGLTRCSPEARFLLEVIAARAMCASAGEVFRGKQLAVQLHMPEGVVSAALGELVTAGVVERLEAVSGGKGRPTISHQIAPSTLTTLEGRQNPYGLHAGHLKRLFSGADIAAEILGRPPKVRKERAAVTKAGKPAPPGARSRLSICNRLLMGVLLAHADCFGVVRDISSLQLRHLTGFDAESLKHRLQRLMGVGLIRSYIPGVSSAVFRIKKISSTYFLNLNHPGFVVKGSCSVLVHVAPKWKAKLNDHVDVLRRDVLTAGSSTDQVQLETSMTVIRFLAGQRVSVFNVLRLMLLQYASDLLMRHWLDLGVGRAIDYGWLRKRIARDLRRPSLAEWPKVNVIEEREVVIRHFCNLVVEIAQEYRSRFGSANWIEFDSIGISILPVLRSDGYETIAMVLQPQPLAVSECTVLWERAREEVIPESWGVEAEVPLDYRTNCGLVTSPARRLLKR